VLCTLFYRSSGERSGAGSNGRCDNRSPELLLGKLRIIANERGVVELEVFGVVGEGIARLDSTRLTTYRDTQANRGPDSYGEFEGRRCFLGHNRLRIIDLTDRARQPMADVGGRFQLVYNGEIYNDGELRRAAYEAGACQYIVKENLLYILEILSKG